MNFEVINFFPTTAYVGKIENHATHKKSFYEVYPKFNWEKDQFNTTVSENVGNPLLHLEEGLNALFQEIIEHIKSYAQNVLLLKDVFDFTITKTWISRAQNSEDEIPWHIHSTSHISFAYYVNVPQNAHALKFSNQHLPNSLFLGMTKDHKDYSRQFVKEYNDINCETFYMIPSEGNIIIFPSKITHSTCAMSSDFGGERLAIIGDVTLVLKEEYLSHSMGYISQKYWKTYK